MSEVTNRAILWGQRTEARAGGVWASWDTLTPWCLCDMATLPRSAKAPGWAERETSFSKIFIYLLFD